MSISRRTLLATSLIASAFAGVAKLALARTNPEKDPGYFNQIQGYGPLVDDPEGRIDLPEGFSYTMISKKGEVMNDGLLVPGLHDGMGCFAHPNSEDLVILVRNHEIKHTRTSLSAFGPKGERIRDDHKAKVYDYTTNGEALPGGTTTLVYDLKAKKLLRHHLSLVGTSTNCGGGTTPWGSWLTCEETVQSANDGVTKNHGYVFEVPALAEGLVQARPLTAMGRFEHEACCVDPKSGIVYMTEDKEDSAFYRFIPRVKGKLHLGGRLQALKIDSQPKAITSNKKGILWKQNDSFSVSWVELDDVENPLTVVRKQAISKGCAQFARAEGISLDGNALYFTATSGGPNEFGQIIRYTLSPSEGKKNEAKVPGIVSLFYQSDDLRVFDYGDNLTVSPFGTLFVCEDRYSEVLKNHVRIITKDGFVTTFCRNRLASNSEFAGACFSPDGSTFFVNIQTDGITLAITGPWERFIDTV